MAVLIHHGNWKFLECLSLDYCRIATCPNTLPSMTDKL